jgi:hypothetical protein
MSPKPDAGASAVRAAAPGPSAAVMGPKGIEARALMGGSGVN